MKQGLAGSYSSQTLRFKLGNTLTMRIRQASNTNPHQSFPTKDESFTLKTINMQPPMNPGEILLEDYLNPMGISQNAMARAIGVSPRAINEIVHGKRSITPTMSIRFGAFFGQSDQFWHGIQVECDFRRLAADKQSLISGVTPAASLTNTS